MTIEKEPVNHGLDNLAAQADALGCEADAAMGPQVDPQQAQQEAAAAAAMQAGATKLFLGVLKSVRSMLSKKLPEILTHWGDDDLRHVAEAIFPVANKHLERLMPMIGAYPEEAALAMAALPLMLGYFAALSSHADKEDQAAATKNAADKIAIGALDGDRETGL